MTGEQTRARQLDGQLMRGRRGVVMGIANDHSIAWGIARQLQTHGSQLGLTCQAPVESRVRKLADSLELEPECVQLCAADDSRAQEQVFARFAERWGGIDFLVHAIAFSDKSELSGRYMDTSRENFLRTMEISCFSFTTAARAASPHMSGGGSMLTLSYLGAERAIPNYNVMGVAKAALEASVRYLACDLGDAGIRVNGLSAGPMRTLSGSAIAGARAMLNWSRDHSPLRRAVDLEDVGGAALYLLSDLSAGVSGEIHHVDAGYHAVGMPDPARITESARGK